MAQAIDCAPASSSRVISGPLVNIGASFTGITIMSNDSVALSSIPPFVVPPSSFNFIVIVAVPFSLGAEVKVNVPSLAMAG